MERGVSLIALSLGFTVAAASAGCSGTAGGAADGEAAAEPTSAVSAPLVEASTDNWRALPSVTSRSFTVTPYEDSNESAFTNCPAGTTLANRPIALWFGGGLGTLEYNGKTLTGLAATVHPFRTSLRSACVRLVVMLASTSYFSGASAPTYSYYSGRTRLDQAARDIRVVVDRLFYLSYRDVSKYWYIGGSMSAMLGMKLLETNQENTNSDPDGGVPAYSATANRLRGSFLAGPPIDSLSDLCDVDDTKRHFASGSLGEWALGVLTGTSSCATLRGLRANGALFDAAKVQAAANAHPISLYVGGRDEIWSGTPTATPPSPYWTGVQGTENFLRLTNIRSQSRTTYDVVPLGTHGTTWTNATSWGVPVLSDIRNKVLAQR